MVKRIKPDDHLYVGLVDYRDPFAPVVYVLTSGEVWRAAEAENEAYRVHKPHWRRGSLGFLHDPLPSVIEGYPATNPYKPGWLEKYREAWHRLPPPGVNVLDQPPELGGGK